MMEIAELTEKLQRLNRARLEKSGSETLLETDIQNRYHPNQKLTVYGTLSPGETNFSVVRSIGGHWEPVEIEGERFTLHYGPDNGYPAFRWEPGGSRHPAMLLKAPALPEHWERLDRFEGPAYSRILIPVFHETGVVSVANAYQAHLPSELP